MAISIPHSLDQILPSLQALGIWSYWIIGLAAFLEGFFLAGWLVPGMLAVASGGILVQQGLIDYLDLAWFVAIGSFLGGEASYWTGVLARKGLERKWDPENWEPYQRARRLFQRRGGAALVIGRFFGPLAGFVTLAAALSGMDRRKFVIWNVISAIPYALIVPLAGYLLGDVFSKFGPLATRAALFGLAILIVLGILWWLVVRVERLLPFFWSILKSIGRAVVENQDVRAWSGRHPRLSRFIVNRFETGQFSGLTATLIGVAVAYVLFIWVGGALAFLKGGAIVQADTRLANLVHEFWSPLLLKAFAYVTAFGGATVIIALLAAACVWLWTRRRVDLMLGLIVAVIGNVLTVSALKAVFHRPRPELAYFIETSGSFPSGHSAISVAFYGTLFYILWRLGKLGPIKAALFAATIAFFIGLSRIYLIEHYLSDVLNGWTVGALWMLIGIALAEWWKETHLTPPDPAAKLAAPAMIAALLLLGFAGFHVATYDKARNIAALRSSDETVSDIAALFTSGAAPVETGSVFGNPLEPVNIIVVAKDEAQLNAAMKAAGWTEAEQPTFANLFRAAWAVMTNVLDEDAPVTPYFWQAQPNDTAFQRPTPEKTLRKRHHVRFWQSRYVTADGLRLFVGAASYDDGMDWQLLHHIDPNIDAERDQIVSDLTAAGVVSNTRLMQLSKARLGNSVAGDPWFTDGKSAVLTLR